MASETPTRLGRLRRALLSLRALRLLLTAGLLGGGAWLTWSQPYLVDFTREQVWDELVSRAPRQPPANLPFQVRVIDIDERSLDRHGQWPWPRTRIARLLDELRAAGARVAVMDTIFAEPDRTTLARVIDDLSADLPDFQSPLPPTALAALPDNDQVLVRALRRMPTVLGFSVTESPTEGRLDSLPRIRFDNRRHQRYLPRYEGSVASLPELQAAAAMNAALIMVTDPDGVLRWVPLLVRAGPDNAPTLSSAALAVALEAPIAAHSRDRGLEAVSIGAYTIPTDRFGRMRLYDSGSRPDRYVSATDVLDGTLPEGALENAIVVVGSSAAGLKDIRITALEGAVPGVEIHLQALEQILAGQFLTRPDSVRQAELAGLIAVSLLMLGLAATQGGAAQGGRRSVPIAPWMIAVIAAGGVTATALWAFQTRGVLVDPLWPAGTVLLAGLVERLILLAEVHRERSRIRNAFTRYLAPALVDRLSADPSMLRLGGDRRDLTVMFADVRGFTAISERFSDRPEDLTRLINRLLTPLTEAVLAEGGTVDKYMGDCIMAFWNAPVDVADHARAACRTALAFRRAMVGINAELSQDPGLTGLLDGLAIGTGLNSGTCFVGNMGADQRFDYSVIGNAVNLASRLEGQCKTYLVDVVVGEETARLAGDAFRFFELDRVAVKGMQRPAAVFTLLAEAPPGAEPDLDRLIDRQGAFLTAYRSQDWDAAESHLEALKDHPAAGPVARYLGMMAGRLAAFRATPPGTDWDGTFRATEK
ncbi:CHASE2 domain-containing protein [Roseospirillum parvum]|uniref:Adenylate cyclase n=1 Tax=Roseospirillum parvum TaxID=83401 RepID=A0A1G7YB51_9PROT|nr:adenylate/guanylate cyclase domain-containing protein [Roseospirillum parvum]SDG93615.1 adenylate cyclase [Roseospirillum parvum]